MIFVNLPAPQSPPIPFLDVSVVLDDVTYTLSFHWNSRDDGWYMTVLDESGQVIILGAVRLVADWPLYRNVVTRKPPGLLMVRDTSGAGSDPGLSDLGGRCVLVYLTDAEAAELGI